MDEGALGCLRGSIALVTGGSRGIGKEIALELARRGASIAFTYFRNHEAAREAEAAITECSSDRPLKVRANIGDTEACTNIIDAVKERFGALDILVNNAASGVMRTASDTTPKHWDWTLSVNAKAPWLISIRAATLMKEGGRIINISSPGSGRVLPPYFSVGISKAALEAVTRYLAIELAPRGIAVNTVSAGFVMTDALDAFSEEWDIKRFASRPTPAGRNVSVRDVAKVVAMMCGPDASMIRGQVINVDGGETLLYR